MINIKYDFLEDEKFEEFHSLLESKKGTPSFEINYMGRWGKGLESGSYSGVYILPLEQYKDYFFEKYTKEVDPRFGEMDDLTVFMHVWPPGSQINWHHDAPAEANRLSSTIYLNKNWSWNWGGLFLYDDPDMAGKQGWLFPHRNSMTWFKPPLWHSTTMVTLDATEPRLSIQLFFTKYGS